ncbi:protein DA1-like isoform X2 [Andrographis paniculata]|uniref:protein DA1-like isoform X2 n=1 Tax=Andrographis paniculata TaxID=175694 RepID=UPI0021E8C5F6|nr:protein DA1-like isoform X2 [Andrographis paniculata]
MGWLSRIFGGSNSRYSCSYETDTAGNLSPVIEDHKGEGLVIESKLQDDELAWGVRESWDTESSSGTAYGYGYTSDSLYQPISFPYDTSFGNRLGSDASLYSGRICAGCNMDVGYGRYVSCMDALWHPECFRCRGCSQPISDYEFSVHESCPYHKTCYEETHHLRCDVCRHVIPANAVDVIEYRAHPFWSQKYCPKHEHDGTPRCCSCERMESWNTRFNVLGDGRKLCSECFDSAIMESNACQPLYRDIQKFFKGLNMKVLQQIPLLLVDKPALIEAMGGETHGHHQDMPETRGLCLAEERTVNQVLPRPRIRFGIGNRTRSPAFKPTFSCEVTAILILLLTGIILAHEMMHAWLRLNGYQNLRQDVEEGICQVVASLWLDSRIVESLSKRDGATTTSKQGSMSPFERKLGKFLMHQMATDSSDVYGNGFRAARRAVVGFGLRRTLDSLRKTGHFPS